MSFSDRMVVLNHGERIAEGRPEMVANAPRVIEAPLGRPMLLLDEPSLGLAPVLVTSIFANLAQINREGVTILLVEPNVPRALRRSQLAYVLENGRIAGEGRGSPPGRRGDQAGLPGPLSL